MASHMENFMHELSLKTSGWMATAKKDLIIRNLHSPDAEEIMEPPGFSTSRIPSGTPDMGIAASSSSIDTSWTGSFDGLETPVPLVDLGRLERNLDRMASYTRSHALALRPHSKTHKSPRIGAEQVRRGAVGLTCATPLELEVMAEVCDDLLLAYPPVGTSKLRRLMSLRDTVRLTVALDSVESADQLGRAAAEAGRSVGVLVEIDVGLHRVGVQPLEEMLKLVRSVADQSFLEYRGIAFYPGHIRGGPMVQEDLARLGAELQVVLRALDKAGLHPEVVSGGSTPTVWHSHLLEGVTEIRPGTYVYNDRTTVQTGACGWEDCALTVLATVVSTAVPGQAVIDAGSKALGREPPLDGQGFGVVIDQPDVTVVRLSEEHGILDLGTSGWRARVGDTVRILPNHGCIVVHAHEKIYGVRDGRVETSWPVTARGRQPLQVETRL
jgi:D-serine deaminase-like pyridoxal phosphate-dependent protein